MTVGMFFDCLFVLNTLQRQFLKNLDKTI